MEPKTVQTARRFAEYLRKDIGPFQMAAVIYRNRIEPNSGVCHSHDFLDANMVMAEAYESVYGEEPRVPSLRVEKRWNRAWSIARAFDFNIPEHVPVRLPEWKGDIAELEGH